MGTYRSPFPAAALFCHGTVVGSVLGWVLLFVAASPTSAQVSWTEEAAARGVANLYTYGASQHWGRGFALNDFDNDGDVDLMLTGRYDGQVLLFSNDGSGYFTEATPGSGLPSSFVMSGVATADFNGDGLLDVYFSLHEEPNLLYQNQGGLTFSAATTPPLDDDGQSLGCAWGDYNGDSQLDLFVSNHETPSRLYRNEGAGNFSDQTQAILFETAPTFQGLFFDHDRDGDLDLYVSNDKQDPNRFYLNEVGMLTEVGALNGAGIVIDSMGVGCGDLNRDGYLDLYLTNTEEGGSAVLLISDTQGGFVDQSVPYGLNHPHTTWGAPIFDYDNDGYEDLFVAASDGPDAFFLGGPNLPLTESAGQFGLDSSEPTYCAEPADLDGDGDLDLVVQAINEPIRIYINQVGHLSHWLAVKLSSSSPNRFGLGAIVEVLAGGQTQIRAILGTGSYKTSRPHTVHFGLGGEATVERVRVYWPSGLLSEVYDLSADQVVTIDDSSAVLPAPRWIRGDVNQDLLFTLADVIAGLQVTFLGQPNSCHATLDIDANGEVGLSDFFFGLSHLILDGPAPAAPFPDCEEGALNSLSCLDHDACP